MNATNRWAYHFANEMECVRCGGEGNNRRTTFIDLHTLDLTMLGLDEIFERLAEIDVFCRSCLGETLRGLRRRAAFSEARLDRKQQAYHMAVMRSAMQWQSKYDTFVLNGHEYTKREYLESLRSGVCSQCGIESHNLKYRSSQTKLELSGEFTGWFHELPPHLIHEHIQNATPLCPSCFQRDEDKGETREHTSYDKASDQRASRIKARLLLGHKGRDIAADEGVSAVYVTKIKKGEKASDILPCAAILRGQSA